MFHFQLMALAPDEESRLRDYCASAVLAKTLMLGGYGFDEETFPHIFFQRKVRRSSLLQFRQNQYRVMQSCSSALSGWRRLGGLGPGIHAYFEQPAARRGGGADEGPEPGRVGDPHLSARPAAGSGRRARPLPVS